MRVGSAVSYADSVSPSSSSVLSSYQQVFGAQGVRPFHSLVYTLPYTYAFSTLLGSGAASMNVYTADGSAFSTQSYALAPLATVPSSGQPPQQLQLCVWDYPTAASYGHYQVDVSYCDQPA